MTRNYDAGYISTSINDGPGCLLLRCPDPSCCAAVGQDMIQKLASDENKEKYFQYIVRSYVENKKKVVYIYYLELTTVLFIFHCFMWIFFIDDFLSPLCGNAITWPPARVGFGRLGCTQPYPC